MDEVTKVCNVCRVAKPLEAFSRDKAKSYGRAGRCRECNRAACAAWHAINRDDVLARRRAAYAASPQKLLDENKRWREANPERKAASDREWREANRERAAATKWAWKKAHWDSVTLMNAAWKARNPYKVSELAQRRRARTAGNGVSQRDWRRLCARYDWNCAYCGSAGPLTVEHVVPLSRGGLHSIGNILPACLSCNSSKRDRFLVEWRRLRRAAS